MNASYAITIILIAGGITFAIRYFPFALFSKFKDKMPAPVAYLGNILPQAAIAILLVYCLKSVNFSAASSYLPQTISLAVVFALHIIKRNFILSIASGTVVYMILVQSVFV